MAPAGAPWLRRNGGAGGSSFLARGRRRQRRGALAVVCTAAKVSFTGVPLFLLLLLLRSAKAGLVVGEGAHEQVQLQRAHGAGEALGLVRKYPPPARHFLLHRAHLPLQVVHVDGLGAARGVLPLQGLVLLPQPRVGARGLRQAALRGGRVLLRRFQGPRRLPPRRDLSSQPIDLHAQPPHFAGGRRRARRARLQHALDLGGGCAATAAAAAADDRLLPQAKGAVVVFLIVTVLMGPCYSAAAAGSTCSTAGPLSFQMIN